MNFSHALEYVKIGRRVTMNRWNPGDYVRLVRPAEARGGAASIVPRALSFVEKVTARGDRYPWTPDQAELLATDYKVMDEDE